MLKAPKNAHLRQQSVFRINKLQNIVKELVSTEEQYVRVLFQFYYEVITPIREKKILKPHIVRECFPSMTNNLYTLHKCLLEDLRPIAQSYSKEGFPVGAGTEWFQRDRELFNIMQQWLPGFGLYKNYIIEHHECLDRLKEEMKKTKKLRKFIDKACSRFSKSIDSYFIAPIQRLPRYILLFDEITKFQKGELVTLFDKTKMEIEQLTHDMNQTKKWFDQSKDGQQLLERQPVLRKVAVRLDNGMLDARVYFHTRVMLHDRTEPRAKKFRLHVLQMQIVLEPLQKTTLFQNALPKVLYFDQWFHYESTGDHCHFPNALLLFSSSYSGLISFEMRRDMQACLDALKDISLYHTLSRKNILSSHTNRKIWVRCLVCQNEFADSGGNLEKTKCLSCGRWLCNNCCKESHQNKIVCEHCKTMFTKGSHIVQKVADPDKTNKTKHVRKGTPHSIKARTFTPPHSPSSTNLASFDSSTQRHELIRSFSSPEIGGWTLIDDDEEEDEMVADPYTPDPIKADDQSGVTVIEYPSMAFRIEVSEQEDWSCSPRSDPARFTPLTNDPTNLLGENLQSDPEDMSEEDDSIEMHSPSKTKSPMKFSLDPTMKPTRIGAFLASLRVEDFSRGSHRRSLTMGSSPLKHSPRVIPSRAFRPFKRHSLTDALFGKSAEEAETRSLPSLSKRRKSLNDIDGEEVYATNIPLPLPSSVAIASDRRKRSESSEESVLVHDYNHLSLPPHRDSISEESSAIGTVDLNFLGSEAEHSESTRDSFYEAEAKEEEEMVDHHRRISSSDAQKRCSPDRTLLTSLSISIQNDLEIKPKVQNLQLSFQTSTSQNVLPDPFFEHFTYGTPITIAKPAPRKFSSQEKREASRQSNSHSHDQDSGGSGGSSRSNPYQDFSRKPPRGRQTSPKRPGPPRKLTNPLPAQTQNTTTSRYPYPNRPIPRKRPAGPHYTRRTIGTASEMHALESSSDDYPPIPYRKKSEPYDTAYHSRGPPSTWRKPAYGPPNPYHPQPIRAQTVPRPMRTPNGVDFPRSPTGPSHRPVQNHANTVTREGPLQSLPSKFYDHMRQNETSHSGHLVPQHAQHSSRPLDRHPHRRPNVPQFSANQPLSHQHTVHSVQKPKGVSTVLSAQLRHGDIRKAFETYAFNNHLTSVGFQLALNDLGYPGSEFLSPANQPISFMQFVRIVAFRETE